MTDQKKLEELFDLTAHPGWKILLEDLVNRVEAMKEGLVRNEATAYQQGLAQGHVKVYREFISLRDMLEQIMKQQSEDESEAAAV